MATKKQIEANRRNTGEAIHIPLQDENPMEYHDLHSGLMETWQPENAQEEMLVDNIASAYLRMQRASRFEAALLSGPVPRRNQEHGNIPDSVPAADFGIMI